jgi:hypothetical protein
LVGWLVGWLVVWFDRVHAFCYSYIFTRMQDAQELYQALINVSELITTCPNPLLHMKIRARVCLSLARAVFKVCASVCVSIAVAVFVPSGCAGRTG